MADANSILADWNRMERTAAAETILPCNGSRAWAEGVARLRPFAEPRDLFAASDEVWGALRGSDRQQAFETHPRLGAQEAKAASAQSLRWSAEEQSAATPDEILREALAEANRAYEAKFRRVFLLCAAGRSAAEILAILRSRMENDAVAELHEAAEQQLLITQLRLRRWLEMPALTCAELAEQTRMEAA
jgi:2-oxo-4-hydroxy-4-carboxy-5-ureidoimidazoline decarboxylase